jgi:hypothetical protein
VNMSRPSVSSRTIVSFWRLGRTHGAFARGRNELRVRRLRRVCRLDVLDFGLLHLGLN